VSCNREVFDVRAENLPSADVADNSISCDVCTKKGLKRVPAIIYCTVCRKLFCRKHDEVILLLNTSSVDIQHCIL